MNVVTELTIALFIPPLTQQTRTLQMNHKDSPTSVLGMNDPDFVFLSTHGCSTGHLTASTILAARGKSSSLLTPAIIPFLSFGKHFVDVLYQYMLSIYQAHVFPRLRGSGRSFCHSFTAQSHLWGFLELHIVSSPFPGYLHRHNGSKHSELNISNDFIGWLSCLQSASRFERSRFCNHWETQ